MQGLFIFAIVLAVVAGIFLTVAYLIRASTDEDVAGARVVLRAAGGIFAAGAAVTVFFCSFNAIGTRDIGVVTSFGRLSGHLGSGIGFTAPWDRVTTIDDSYQLTDETFTVRIKGGQTAQAQLQVRWNAVQDAADDIFANYKTTAGMEKGLLSPELNVAANTVLEDNDPITPLATGAAPGSPKNPNTAQLGAAVKAYLTGRVGNDINVQTLNLKPLAYDTAVQNQINAATNQAAKTVVAKEAEQTATAQAAANKALEQGLVNNPMVLVQQCFTGLADGTIQNQPGFSCWPGSNSGVVIPSAGTPAAAKK
jgi:regulator of protease activity HflC (stomatin/prohibitin superfamily)